MPAVADGPASAATSVERRERHASRRDPPARSRTLRRPAANRCEAASSPPRPCAAAASTPGRRRRVAAASRARARARPAAARNERIERALAHRIGERQCPAHDPPGRCRAATAPASSAPFDSSAWTSTKGSARTTPACATARAASARKRPPESAGAGRVACAVNASRRLRSSPSNPFMTDRIGNQRRHPEADAREGYPADERDEILVLPGPHVAQSQPQRQGRQHGGLFIQIRDADQGFIGAISIGSDPMLHSGAEESRCLSYAHCCCLRC